MAGFRLADPSLRRYATHMTGNNADVVLHHVYVTAAQWPGRMLDDGRVSIELFREVHARSALAGLVEPEEGAGELENALRSLPIAERGALLLTAVEGLSTEVIALILGVPQRSLAELVASATFSLLRRTSDPDLADPATLGRALGDLKVRQATPRFWNRVAFDVAAAVHGQPRGADSGPVGPEPGDQPIFELPVSIWPALVLGAVAIAVIVLTFMWLPFRNGDPESSVGGSGDAGTVGNPPATAETPSGGDRLPAGNGISDRGGLPLIDGLAILEGSLAAGSVDRWQVEVAGGEILSIAVTGLGGVTLAVIGSDGLPLSAVYADEGLQVYGEPGRFSLEFSSNDDLESSYSVGIGLTGSNSGFLTSLDERGAAVSILQVTSCETTLTRLETELESIAGGDLEVSVAFGSDDRVDTVDWSAAGTQTTGEIGSATPVPTGVVFSGDIAGGRDAVVGLPFWLAVYGCFLES
jgi:hypothetical protein